MEEWTAERVKALWAERGYVPLSVRMGGDIDPIAEHEAAFRNEELRRIATATNARPLSMAEVLADTVARGDAA